MQFIILISGSFNYIKKIKETIDLKIFIYKDSKVKKKSFQLFYIDYIFIYFFYSIQKFKCSQPNYKIPFSCVLTILKRSTSDMFWWWIYFFVLVVVINGVIIGLVFRISPYFLEPTYSDLLCNKKSALPLVSPSLAFPE